MLEQLTVDLIADIENSMEVFEKTGALPSPIMEKPYCMLRCLRSDKDNQRIVSFMVLNYFIPKYGYRTEDSK